MLRMVVRGAVLALLTTLSVGIPPAANAAAPSDYWSSEAQMQQREAELASVEASNEQLLPAESPCPLTGRERDVVNLAAAGWASRRIAEHLGLSVRTVDNHLGRAHRKLGVTGRRSITTGG